MQYPECFITGEIDYNDDLAGRGHAIADALSGWGCCAFTPPPENFGTGMAAITQFLNVGAVLPSTIMKISDDWNKQWDDQNT